MDKQFQVFVSSTYEDLQEERQEVMHALLELNCIPSGMELFPAANESQWSVIKRVIDDCDYYILIVAGRYGSVAHDGISYTEREYHYAESRGKPVISFLHKDPGSIPANKSETTDEGKAKLASFRKQVEQKLCKPWTTPAELGSVVSRSLIQLIKTTPAIGWVRADELPDKEATLELLKLRKRVDELQSELERARTTAPKGTEELKQGEELHTVNFSLLEEGMNRSLIHDIEVAKGSMENVIALFYDIRGFSRFCSNENPLVVNKLIKDFYLYLLGTHYEKACYLKLVGDGLLFIFKHTISNKVSLPNTIIRASYKIIKEFPKRCEKNKLTNEELPTEIGVGISPGMAIRLFCGTKTLDYIGDCVNVAARLNNLARPKGIVIDSRINDKMIPTNLISHFKKHKIYVPGISEDKGQIIYASSNVILPKHALSPMTSYTKKRERIEYDKEDIMNSGQSIDIRLHRKPLSAESISITFIYPSNVSAQLQKHQEYEDFNYSANLPYKCTIELPNVKRILAISNLDPHARVCFRIDYMIKLRRSGSVAERARGSGRHECSVYQ